MTGSLWQWLDAGPMLLVLKVTLLALLAVGAAALLRRARASARHAIFAAFFIALLLLPVIGHLVPSTEVPVLPQREPAETTIVPAAPLIATNEADNTPVAPSAKPFSLAATALAVYLAGVVALAGAMFAGVIRLRRWSQRAEVWLDGMRVASEVAAAAGIRRAVLVVRCNETSVPFTFGFWRQTIVMPASASEWSESELRGALRHELEHVRRDDWAMQFAARIACAAYWPHPLVWMAWRRFCVEAERACDDAVISSAEATAYASQLVTLARSISRPRAVPVLAMASPSRLSERVDAILDATRPRGPQTRGAMLVIAAAMFSILTTFGSVRLVAAASDAIEDGVREGVEGALDEVEDDVDTWGEALVKAAERGDIAALETIFEKTSISINTTIDGDGTALLIAARAGRMTAVRWLLDQGADPNVPSPGDGNALIGAAGSGEVEIMDLLLARGARVDDVVHGDENALIAAASAGMLDAVRLLVERGADVNARVWSGREWRTPLMMARRNGDPDVIKHLIAAGARD